MENSNYDVIIIGSGAGGLAAAVPLAQAGLSVIVYEQHEVPGGWTHSFILNNKYRFSPGVHYIGGIGPGGSMKKIYEGLGVSNDLSFYELNPNGYDHIMIANEQFDLPKGKENLSAKLKERFPHEEKGIDSYLNMVSKMIKTLQSLGDIETIGGAIKSISKTMPVIKWLFLSGQDLIDRYISDPLLKGILSAQSGDHGMPPSQVSAFVHAGITHHYFDGGYYPKGGAYTIPRAFIKALKRAGGEIRVKNPVEKILIKDKKVIGIQLADGSEITAKYIISNADPETTFGKMIGRGHLSKKLNRKLNKVKYSISSLSLFFAVDMDLQAAGLDSGNYWLYDHEDLNRLYRMAQNGETLVLDEFPALFLTITTLKDPTKKIKEGHHTCEAFAFVGYNAFSKWSNEVSGKRSEDYQELKKNLAESMFKAIEKRIPGIREKVVYWNLGTPLTNEHYINTTRGNIYGIEKSRKQVGPGAFPIQTEFKNLLMCGASTLSHGIAGVTVSGLAAAAKILQCDRSYLLNQKGPELKVELSDKNNPLNGTD